MIAFGKDEFLGNGPVQLGGRTAAYALTSYDAPGKAEDGRTEVGGRKSEDRRTEDRSQKSEVRGRKDRGQKLEIRSQRTEGQRTEIRRQRSEVGSRRSPQ